MTTLTALNGRLPASLLVLIERGQSLRTDAAASWRRMEAAGMPRGCLRSGYRNLALQAVLVLAGQTVAVAGTSWHGEGLAADVDEPARMWVRAHLAAYGWLKDRVPHEPWHMEYDPARDQHAHAAPTPPPVIPTPAPNPTGSPQEDDMLTLITWCYAHLMGRDPSTREVLDRIGDFNGWSTAQVRDWFLASRAEPGTVTVTFREFLGHDPNPAQVTEWSAGQTVKQVRDGIAGSPEALARK